MSLKPPSAQIAFLVLLLMIAVAPLFAGPPSLIDYDNHVVRAMLLAQPSAAAYVPDWGIKPNLAMDAFIWLAAKVMPVEMAARLFVGLTLAVLLAGAAAVAKVVHGRLGVVHAASAIFLYNVCLLHGLLGFLFGIGLAMLAFAGWMAATSWSHAAKLTAFTVVCIALFFCHLFALGAFLMLAGTWEIGRRRGLIPMMDGLVTLGTAAIPAILLFFAVPAGPADSPIAHWSLPWFHVALLLFGPFASAANVADTVSAIVFFVSVAVVVAVRGRAALLAPQMVLPVLAVWAIAVVMPGNMLGGAMVDARLPVLGMFLLVAAVPPETLPSRLAPLAVAVLMALTSWRAAGVAAQNREHVERHQAVTAIEQIIPRGARVIISNDMTDDLLLTHQFDYLAADRGAFVSTLNAQRDQQPLGVAPAYADVDVGRKAVVWPIRDLKTALTAEGQESLLRNPPVELSSYIGTPWFFGWQNKFDYLVLLEQGGPGAGLPELLDEVASGTFFRIYRIRHQP